MKSNYFYRRICNFSAPISSNETNLKKKQTNPITCLIVLRLEIILDSKIFLAFLLCKLISWNF